MKNRYKIYNFDHGVKHPYKTNLRPFTISINEEHCENLARIPHDEKYTYTYDTSDPKITPIIQKTAKVEGEWIETSIIEIDTKNIRKSILYGESDHNTIDDLCLILSFLTGRRVSYENDRNIHFHNPRKHVDKVVHKGFILRTVLNWKDIKIVKESNLGIQLYNLTLGYECENLIAQGAYVNSVFNGIYDEWFLKNKLKKIIKEKTDGKIIDKNLKNKIKNIAFTYFEKENIHPIVKDDFYKKLNELWTPTVTTKIGFFLGSLNLFYGYTQQEKKRLDWLSKVRNSFAHCGDIPKDKDYSFSRRIEISSCIISIVLRIVQYYFASQILKIDDPYLDYIKNQIVEYINKGIFSGRKVFDETFEQYVERTNKEWLGV